MIDLCFTCVKEEVCYLDRYCHKDGKCDHYTAKWDVQHNRSAIIKAHPPRSAQKTNITRAEPVVACPKCHSVNTQKHGHFKVGDNLVRRYKCSDCGEKFISEQKQESGEGDRGELGSIQLRQTCKDELAALKREGESFEDVVVRLIKEHHPT